MRRKSDLDNAVAMRLSDCPKWVVTKVTAAFIDEIIDALCKEGQLHIDNLGKLMVTIHDGGQRIELTNGTFKKGETAGRRIKEVPYKVRVNFRKAPYLRGRLAEKAKRKSWRTATKKKR